MAMTGQRSYQMEQSKLGSFIEALMNTVIGYILNLGVQLLVYPAFGATFTFTQNIYIGLIFMVVSITRSFVIRRYMNARLHKIAQGMANSIGKSAQ